MSDIIRGSVELALKQFALQLLSDYGVAEEIPRNDPDLSNCLFAEADAICSLFRAALDRAEADDVAAVVVKPLEWHDHDGGLWSICQTVLGQCGVQRDGGGQWGYWVAGQSEDDEPYGHCGTSELAKSAAKADYTARIFSALEPDGRAQVVAVADHTQIDVGGDIGNYYGGLLLKREGGKDYWAIENYTDDYWEPVDATIAAILRAQVAK